MVYRAAHVLLGEESGAWPWSSIALPCAVRMSCIMWYRIASIPYTAWPKFAQFLLKSCYNRQLIALHYHWTHNLHNIQVWLMSKAKHKPWETHYKKTSVTLHRNPKQTKAPVLEEILSSLPCSVISFQAQTAALPCKPYRKRRWKGFSLLLHLKCPLNGNSKRQKLAN